MASDWCFSRMRSRLLRMSLPMMPCPVYSGYVQTLVMNPTW